MEIKPLFPPFAQKMILKELMAKDTLNARAPKHIL